MRIIVPIKRVPDYGSRLVVDASGARIVEEDIKFIANPFDEIAVEEALRLREAGVASEVVAVSIGKEAATAQIRHALAMGADRGILVRTDSEVDSFVAASLLAAVWRRESPQMCLMGKQAIDTDANQTAQILSTLLSVPQACFASRVTVAGQVATVVREVDGGLETVTLPIPCVISADLRLNEPRYASLPGIMKAKKKQLDEVTPQELGVEVSPRVKTAKLLPPPKKVAGRKVADVNELIEVLRQEAKVI